MEHAVVQAVMFAALYAVLRAVVRVAEGAGVYAVVVGKG